MAHSGVLVPNPHRGQTEPGEEEMVGAEGRGGEEERKAGRKDRGNSLKPAVLQASPDS